MPVAYPSYLPPPQQEGYGRTELAQFASVDVQAGPPVNQRISFDRPATYRLTWRFSAGQAAAFRAWFVSQTDYGVMPFTINVLNDGELIAQECRFTPQGIAQITGNVATDLTYSAEVVSRKIESGFDGLEEDLLALAEASPDGDWLQGANLLDVIVNQILPTV